MANEISKIVLKRGTTAKAMAYVGPVGEVVVDTEIRSLRVQDGVTSGGVLLAKDGHIHSFSELTGKPTTLSGYGIVDAQPLDSDLTAFATLSANGLVARTATGAASARQIVVTGAGLSVSNPDGVAGNPTVTSNATSANTPSTLVVRDASGNFSAGAITASLSGNASTATKLATARTLSLAGDASGSASFDGSANTSIAMTLASSGVAAGTYPKVTVDAKGRVTAGSVLAAGDIPDISATYQPRSSNLSSLAALSVATTGFIRLVNGVAGLDTNTYLTGNQTVTVSGDATGSGATTIALTLTGSGVTAGTYRSVTVDAKGRVTAGTNPTTLSGYGITDAAPKASPALTGVPTAPTAVAGTNTSQLATTAFVYNALTAGGTSGLFSALTVDGNAVVSGDLTVNGTTTTVNSVTMTVKDPVVTLGGDNPPTTNDAKDRGVEFRWHDGAAAKTGFFGFDASAGKLTFIPDATNTNEVFSGVKGVIDANLAWTDVTGKPNTLTGYGITDAQPLDADLTAIASLTTTGLIARTASGTAATRSIAVSGSGLSITNADGIAGNPSIILNSSSAATVNSIALRDASGNFAAGTITAALNGNASTATKLATARTIGVSGDATGSTSFDGSAGATVVVTLANSGVTAGSYRSVTVDAKGRVTAGSNPTTLAGYGITDAAPLASPSLVGVPTAPTAATGTNSSQLATTAYVQNVVSAVVNGGTSSGSFSTLTTSGGMSIGGNLSVTGSLTINGTTTTVNSTTVTVDDPVFTLGGDIAPTVDDGKDRGIEFRWHNGTMAKTGFFGFDDSTGKLTFIPDATNTSEVFSGVKGTIDANLEWTDVTGKPTTLTGYGITDAQPLDADLTAIAALSLPGLVVRTSDGGTPSYAVRSIAVSGVGLSITNPGGTAGHPTITSNATNANTASTVVARDANGNFSAGTITASLNGNANTATKLATTRSIALSGDVSGSTSFDGSNNVTIAVSVLDDSHAHAFANLTGKPTTLSGYGITDSQTASRTAANFTTTANGWYRIATSISGIGRNSGEFVVNWLVNGQHGSAHFSAGCHFGYGAGTGIMQTNYTTYGTLGVTEARIVYHTTYAGNYAYVEIKFAASLANVDLGIELRDSLGWTLLPPSTAGGIPAGYSTYTHSFISAGQITAGTFRSVTISSEGRVTAGTNPTTLTGYGITDAQPLDAELTAIAGLGANGLITRTAAGAAAVRSIAVTGVGLSVTNADGVAGNPTVTSNATNANTASTVVARDASGNFSAGTITAALSGNASTATKLATSRTLSLTGDVTGSATFDGSANVAITATVANDSHAHAFSNLTGKPNTLVDYGVTVANNWLPLTYGELTSTEVVLDTLSLNAQTIDSFLVSSFRTAKYLIQIAEGSTGFYSTEAMVVHNGQTAWLVQYGTISAACQYEALGLGSLSVSAECVSGEVRVQVMLPASSSAGGPDTVTVRAIRTAIRP